MPGLPVAVHLDLTDIPGLPGRLVAPQGKIFSITPTVTAARKPVLTLGAVVAWHGNPDDSDAPGYNPPCGHAQVQMQVIPNILVQGKPIAVASPTKGSVCSCGHFVLGPGAVTVLAGSGAGAASSTMSVDKLVQQSGGTALAGTSFS